MRQKTLGLAVALTIMGGVPAMAAPTGWEQCGPAECTTISVPLDHANPGGEQIGIAVARKKATDPSKRIGTLVVLPSWPDESGRDQVTKFSAELSSRFDIVGFDPRGSGGSTQVRCSADLLETWPGSQVPDAATFAKVKTYNNDLRTDCRQHTGRLYDHVSSANVAADLELIRAALGEDKISLHATRYGAIAAENYAGRHADRVRALVLDSPVNSGLDARTLAESSARAADRAFGEWVRWNARTPASPLHGKDVEKLWTDLLARSENPDELGQQAAANLMEPDGWGELSKLLAEQSAEPSVSSKLARETLDYSNPAYLCADLAFRVDTFDEFQTITAAARQLAPRTLGSGYGRVIPLECAGVPAVPVVANPVPRALVTAADLDETAPVEAAVARYGDVVVYEGAGNRVYDRSACTVAVSDSYLIDLAVPAAGHRCAAVDPAV